MPKEIIEADVKKIYELVAEVLKTDEIAHIERMGGLTNHTYHVTLKDNKEYVVRIPGEGTEELIVRKDEKVSTELACSLGIDAKCLYFGEDGSKVTEYINGAKTLSADTIKDIDIIKQIADIFKKLHNSGINTGVPFEVFDMAKGYETIIQNNNVELYSDYDDIKNQVLTIKNEIDKICDTRRIPCHNDALCENWVLGNDKLYLIDWEYAGMNDCMWDLADVSIEAGFDKNWDEILLKNYLDEIVDDKAWKHFYANKIYVDYLWTLWAKTRVPYDGKPMEDWASERYNRLKENINFFKSI